MKRTGSCNQCGACCKIIGFPWTPSPDGGLEWLYARGFRYENGMAIGHMPCPHLKDNRCGLHDVCKPQPCKEFPWGPADLLPGCGFRFEDDVK